MQSKKLYVIKILLLRMKNLKLFFTWTRTITKFIWLQLSIFSIVILLFGCSRKSQSISDVSKTFVTSAHYASIVRGQTIPVYIDVNFKYRTKFIEKSIQRWNRALGGEIKLEVASTSFDMDVSLLEKAQHDKAWFVLNKHDTNPNIPTSNCPPDHPCRTSAWTDDFEGYIINVVEENVSDETLELIINHEIGHLFNLKHNMIDRSSLMYSHRIGNNYSCIDRDSLEQVVNNYQLNSAFIKYDC